MNLYLSDEEANVAVDAMRLRATILEAHLPGIGHIPLAGGWLRETIANLTSIADRIETAREAEWLDRKAAYDAMQSADITESEARALAGDR